MLGSAAGLALLSLAGMAAWAVLRPVGSVPASVGPVGGTGGGRATGRPVGVAAQAWVVRASADAATAAAALAQTETDTTRVGVLLRSAQGSAAEVARLAVPNLARNPSATSPAAAESDLQRATVRLSAALNAAGQEVATATGAAADAAGLSRSIAAVVTEGTAADASAAQATSTLDQARGAAGAAAALLSKAQTEVQAWQAVHAAPSGTLGAVVVDPPADWTVRGCEVVTAQTGGVAATAGLIGRTQRIDPVGDVITSITDATDGNATWPIRDCAALRAAMVQTRVGDRLTIAYEHRHVVWYRFGGTWIQRARSATLSAGPSANCPKPVTGTITPGPAGNRIALRVNLAGPTGVRSGLQVILDTGGVDTTFPNAVLRGLGYKPSPVPRGFGGAVPGSVGRLYLYRIPASAVTVRDQGAFVPVATGTLTVWGMVHGSDYALGPDILKHGAQFASANGRWALTPPCR